MRQQEEREVQHQNEVKTAFANYSADMKESLSSFFTDKKMIEYYQKVQQRKKEKFEHALQANQLFLNMILESTAQKESEFSPQKITKCNNVPKIRTTLKQFFRQWCSQSPQLQDFYTLVGKAKQFLEYGSRILIPGSGLGRLVLEFVEAGFATQGNEVTYFMLYSSNFILNYVSEQNSFQIYPFIHNTLNYESEDDYFRPVTIPDKVAGKVVGENSDFSMAAGEFTEIYRNQKESFDGIVTCFFLDTANNIFQYVDTIASTIKKGGIWINFGPLLYHFKDIFNQVSVQISWQQLIKYVGQYFEVLEESERETSYCHDPKSTYTPVYVCKLTVCRRKT